MNPALIGLGAGASGAGLITDAIGTRQGLKAMADVRKRQFAEQQAAQNQSNAAMQKRIAGVDIPGGFNKATADLNDKAVAQAAQLTSQRPIDGNFSSGLANTAIDAVTNAGLNAAPSLYDSRYNRMVQDSANEQAGIQDNANSLAALYDAQMAAAAGKGRPMRLAGQALQGVGPGLASMGIWQDVGKAAPANGVPTMPASMADTYTANLMGSDLTDPMWGFGVPPTTNLVPASQPSSLLFDGRMPRRMQQTRIFE